MDGRPEGARGSVGKASPKLWMDAYLAAFAMEASLRMVACDTDFNAFAGLDPTILVPPPRPTAGTP